LNNRVPIFIACIRNDAIPIPRATGVRYHIQCRSGVGGGRVTGRPAELTICAVTIKRGACGEGHAAIILLNDVNAVDRAYYAQ